MRDGFLYYFLMRLVRRLPMLLLCLGGILFAVARWKRHPRVSLMTLSAMLIYLVEAIIFIVFLYWLPNLLEPMRLTPGTESWIYSIIFFFEDFVFALVIVLLVGAAFTKRAPQAALAASPPPPDL